MAISLDVLQERIGYRFGDIGYLERAVTHSSYSNETGARNHHLLCNERLEFLGDSVLSLVVSNYLYTHFSEYPEGTLTRIRSSVVCEAALASFAEKIGLGEFLLLGKGEAQNGGSEKPAILADAFEAIVAAIYLDAKECFDDSYNNIIIDLFEKKISEIQNGKPTDYKTLLQQFAEQDGTAVLRYETVQTGELHDPTFTTTAYINNNAVGTGTSGTKKGSEMAAARVALSLFGIIE